MTRQVKMGLWENLIRVHKVTPQQERRGRLLARLIIITGLLDLFLSAANLWSWLHCDSAADQVYFYLGMAGLLIVAGLWYLNRRGKTTLSAALLLAVYIIRIGLINDPGRFSSAFWILTFPILMASFILGPAFSFISAGVSVAVYLLVASHLGVFNNIEFLLFDIIGLFSLATLSYLTASHLDWAFDTVNQSEAKYRNLFNNLPIGLYRTSPSGKILDANSAFLDMFGFPDTQSLQNVSAEELYAAPTSRSKFLSAVKECRTAEMQLRRLDGTPFWVSDHATLVHNEAGEVQYYEGSLIDITERKQAEADLEYLATTDTLTGISNRRHFFDQAERAFARNGDTSTRLAILMIDLDHFKQVNDWYGHATGDAVLREVAQRIQKNMRENDISGRYGGEEFSVLLSCLDKREIPQIANRLIRVVAGEAITVDGKEVFVTMSMGIACQDTTTSTLDALLQRADKALYAAKQAGRNRWIMWDAGLKLG